MPQKIRIRATSALKDSLIAAALKPESYAWWRARIDKVSKDGKMIISIIITDQFEALEYRVTRTQLALAFKSVVEAGFVARATHYGIISATLQIAALHEIIYKDGLKI